MKMKAINLVFVLFLVTGTGVALTSAASHGIDRRALVTRHNVILTQADPLTPLSVGNGEFAFTADITGLQTFPEYHEKGMPLGTQSQWGWHEAPNPSNYQSLRLPLYLPGNGGLLSAVAMMAAGWDGAPDRPCPGFPRDGTWDVRYEGFKRMP